MGGGGGGGLRKRGKERSVRGPFLRGLHFLLGGRSLLGGSGNGRGHQKSFKGGGGRGGGEGRRTAEFIRNIHLRR